MAPRLRPLRQEQLQTKEFKTKMATSAPSRSNNRNRSRNRSRRGGGNNNRGGGGGGGRRYQREKVPRAPQKQSFWEKLLSFFGGGDSKSKKKPTGRKPANSTAKSRATSKPKPKPEQNKSRRVPEKVEVTSTRLYVGNLSYDASEEDLEELFRGVGSVQAAEVVSHRRTQRSKGYAFVHMNSIDEAKRAVEELHDKDFMGRKLVVSGAKSEGPREEEAA
ncbi:MAG: RNA-binding protein [Verrucomicrobiota bacterium]